jgi:peptidoglycan/LPS O-acetylase OafA/YrhL
VAEFSSGSGTLYGHELGHMRRFLPLLGPQGECVSGSSVISPRVGPLRFYCPRYRREIERWQRPRPLPPRRGSSHLQKRKSGLWEATRYLWYPDLGPGHGGVRGLSRRDKLVMYINKGNTRKRILVSDITPTARPEKTAQRGDIQGLRALAVVAVIADHAHIPGVAGGFSGVDVFFVLSGFLITGILLKDVGTCGRIRFVNFYAHRARRILPAATVVLVATAIASALILGVLSARSELTSSVWAVFFAANIHFSQLGTNYFSAASTSPIQHFWSLAVEEQFYLVWPALIALIVVVTRARSRKVVPRVSLGVVLGVLTAGSLYLSIIQSSSNPTASYFSTIDRGYELGIGALIAVCLPALRKLGARTKAVLSVAGLASVVSGIVVFNASTPFPSWRALVPVLGCGALLVGGMDNNGLIQRGLSLRPFRWTGDVSYSLYLWHFPVLVLGAVVLGRNDTLAARLALIAGAFALAGISYYGLENPMRHLKALTKATWRGLILWPVATGLVVATALVAVPSVPFAGASTPPVAVSVITAVAQAVSAGEAGAPVPSVTDPSLLVADSAHVDLGNCDAYYSANWKLCQLGDPTGTKTVVVFGNSHSAMWSPAIEAAAKAAGWKYYPVVHEACGLAVMPNYLHQWAPGNSCSLWYATALVDIKRLHPSVIVIGTYTHEVEWAPGLAEILKQMAPLAKRVVLLSDTTRITNPSSCLLESGATQGTCLFSLSALRKHNVVVARGLAAQSGAQFVDITPWFCDQGKCPSLIDDIVPFFDGSHVTEEYSAYLGGVMASALNLNGGSVVQPVSVPVPAVSSVATTTTTLTTS